MDNLDLFDEIKSNMTPIYVEPRCDCSYFKPTSPQYKIACKSIKGDRCKCYMMVYEEHTAPFLNVYPITLDDMREVFNYPILITNYSKFIKDKGLAE